MGLGIRSVSGRMRRPRPAASTMALVGVTGILGEVSGASYSVFKRSGHRLREENASKQTNPYSVFKRSGYRFA
jgi:hypothetical protein